MGLGEIPGGNLRGYYHLENVNDSSGNAFNLTNNNSVAFNASKFKSGADFGSSGTNKGLTYASNVLSSTTPTDVFCGMFFKLNDTSNHSGAFVVINSETTIGNGINFSISYSITSGTITFTATLAASGGSGNAVATFTDTADTNWHHIFILKRTKTIIIELDGRRKSATNTTTGTLTSATSSPTVYFSVGNNRALSLQCRAIIDEVIVSEGLYTESGGNERAKYYTQSLGKFV